MLQSKIFANGAKTLPTPVRQVWGRVIVFAMSFLRMVCIL